MLIARSTLKWAAPTAAALACTSLLAASSSAAGQIGQAATASLVSSGPEASMIAASGRDEVGPAMAANLVVRMPDHPSMGQLRGLCVELLELVARNGPNVGTGDHPSWPASVAPDSVPDTSGALHRSEGGLASLVQATGGTVEKADSWCEEYLGLGDPPPKLHDPRPERKVKKPRPNKGPARKVDRTEATLPQSSLVGWDSTTTTDPSSSSTTVTPSTLPVGDMQSPVQSFGR